MDMGDGSGDGCGCIPIAFVLGLFAILYPNSPTSVPTPDKWEWVVNAEGYYDRAEYIADGYQVGSGHQDTIVYFSDGRTAHLTGVVEMKYPKTTKIRISQLKHSRGSWSEMEDKYQIEPLKAEAK